MGMFGPTARLTEPPTVPSMKPTWMTTKEMLEYTRMARATFYQYRALGTGPQCIKRGRDLLFRSDWVDEWMLSFLVAA